MELMPGESPEPPAKGDLMLWPARRPDRGRERDGGRGGSSAAEIGAGAGAGAGADTGGGPADPLTGQPSLEALDTLDAHFDGVFGALRPMHVSARHRRRRLAADLRAEIELRSKAVGFGLQAACSRAVMAAVRMHERFLDNVGNSPHECVTSKYHNVLYVVAKLCFDFRLQDSDAVCHLLRAIFYCERTMENLVVGAILGVVCTNVLAGWKSDFESRQQNLQALEYFLERASRGRLRLPGGPGGRESPLLRLPELPLRSYCDLGPLQLAVLMANPDATLLLLRHGVRLSAATPLHAWLGRRACDESLVRCMRILMRAVGRVEVCDLTPAADAGPPPPPAQPAPGPGLYDALYLDRASPEAAMVPEDRRGVRPPSLKHLSRCAVRGVLRDAWQLPFGIYALEIPAHLQRYLDLLED